MIIVDTALERRHRDGNPIRIGLVGAGYMGQGMAAVIERNMVGMRVVAMANRTVETAERVFADAGIEDCVRARARTVPLRTPVQLRQLQFHWGNPPPAAEPSTRIFTTRASAAPGGSRQALNFF